MCIMEVREGQRSSTIAQACAHNVSTVDRDLDMFVVLLTKRLENAGDSVAQAEAQECLERVQQAQRMVNDGYETLLAAYAAELSGKEPTHSHPHEHAGNERKSVTDALTAAEATERYRHDVRLAAQYETR